MSGLLNKQPEAHSDSQLFVHALYRSALLRLLPRPDLQTRLPFIKRLDQRVQGTMTSVCARAIVQRCSAPSIFSIFVSLRLQHHLKFALRGAPRFHSTISGSRQSFARKAHNGWRWSSNACHAARVRGGSAWALRCWAQKVILTGWYSQSFMLHVERRWKVEIKRPFQPTSAHRRSSWCWNCWCHHMTPFHHNTTRW